MVSGITGITGAAGRGIFPANGNIREWLDGFIRLGVAGSAPGRD